MYNIEYNELLSIKRWPSQVMHRKKTRKPSLIQLCYTCLLHHYWHWAPLTSSTYITHILSMTLRTVQYVYMYQRVDSWMTLEWTMSRHCLHYQWQVLDYKLQPSCMVSIELCSYTGPPTAAAREGGNSFALPRPWITASTRERPCTMNTSKHGSMHQGYHFQEGGERRMIIMTLEPSEVT